MCDQHMASAAASPAPSPSGLTAHSPSHSAAHGRWGEKSERLALTAAPPTGLALHQRRPNQCSLPTNEAFEAMCQMGDSPIVKCQLLAGFDVSAREEAQVWRAINLQHLRGVV